MLNIAVIGAGPMGLATAYELGKQGQHAEIFEYDDRLGGMSAHFDFDGMSIERYYHFVCHHDYALFDLMRELGIYDKLHWQDTHMGYYYNNALHKWGDPFSLLRFPHLGLIDKLRYGLHMFLSSKRKKENWHALDTDDAVSWIKKHSGSRAYDVLWKRLFELKFHHHTDNLSAAWIWARIRRVGRSRRSLIQEQMGYIEDGSETLLNCLANKIRQQGSKIHLSTAATKIVTDNGRAIGVQTADGLHNFDAVISTIPLQYVPRLVPDLPEQVQSQYKSITNIGVVCLIFKLAKAVSKNFWLNISAPDIEIPGMIEMSNLRPLPDHIVYVPYYMPQEHPKFKWSDDRIIEEARQYLFRINPELSEKDIIAVHASRYAFAQPICQPEFSDSLPPIKSVIDNLLIADTSYYYPEDRSISESVDLGRKLARMLHG
jgi:protoporphyrinogen oxidase